MELLIWFWLLDSRWFFDFELSIKNFRKLIVLPIITNFTIGCFILYLLFELFYLEINHNLEPCNNRLILWIYSRLLICIMIILISSSLIYISFQREKKEKKYFEHVKNLNIHIAESIDRYDFWIKRKCLLSTPGVIYCLISFLIIFWSLLVMKLFYIDKADVSECPSILIILVQVDSIFCFVTNLPIFLAFLSFFLIKITSALLALFWPSALVWLSNICSRSKDSIRKVDLSKFKKVTSKNIENMSNDFSKN